MSASSLSTPALARAVEETRWRLEGGIDEKYGVQNAITSKIVQEYGRSRSF